MLCALVSHFPPWLDSCSGAAMSLGPSPRPLHHLSWSSRKTGLVFLPSPPFLLTHRQRTFPNFQLPQPLFSSWRGLLAWAKERGIKELPPNSPRCSPKPELYLLPYFSQELPPSILTGFASVTMSSCYLVTVAPALDKCHRAVNLEVWNGGGPGYR